MKRRYKRLGARRALALVLLTALVLAWGYGYWFAWTHTDLWVSVNDYALNSEGRPAGPPHGVTLTFRDTARAPLATARSVEPQGFILADHPSAEIGNCQHAGLLPPAGNASPGDYWKCFKRYAAWSATWASRVHTADVSVGSCRLREVPVTVRVSNSAWLLWWVPLPHAGGPPLKSVALTVAFDSRACAPVRP